MVSMEMAIVVEGREKEEGGRSRKEKREGEKRVVLQYKKMVKKTRDK